MTKNVKFYGPNGGVVVHALALQEEVLSVH